MEVRQPIYNKAAILEFVKELSSDAWEEYPYVYADKVNATKTEQQDNKPVNQDDDFQREDFLCVTNLYLYFIFLTKLIVFQYAASLFFVN